MYFTFIEQVNLTFVEILRRAFATNIDFKWIDDLSQTKISINNTYPLEPLIFPTIVVETSSGNGLLRTMGDDFREEVTTTQDVNGVTYSLITGVKYGGGLDLTTTISVFTKDTVTRDRILDWITVYLRYFFIEKLREMAVNITDMRFAGKDERPYGHDYIYRGRITVTSYSEYEQEIPIDVAETLEAICLTYVGTILPNGTTQV